MASASFSSTQGTGVAVGLVVLQTPPSLPTYSMLVSAENASACRSACKKKPSAPCVTLLQPAPPSVERYRFATPPPNAPPVNTTLALFGATAIDWSYQHCGVQ